MVDAGVAPLRVEVCLALPDRVLRREIQCPAGATCAEAVRLSGLLEEAERAGLQIAGIGRFSRRCAATDPVHDGDRIELYRPLTADPKAARARRAAHQRKTR